VRYATFVLTEQARVWWRSTAETLRGQNVQLATAEEQAQLISWEQFREVFNEKYYPRDWQIQKKQYFMELKQQSHLTVSQYENEFVKLLKYISTSMLSKADKMEQFIQGLRLEVRQGMSYVEANTFREAVAKVANIEKRLVNYRQITRTKELSGEGLKKVVPKQGYRFTCPGGGKFKELKACPKCHKPH